MAYTQYTYKRVELFIITGQMKHYHPRSSAHVLHYVVHYDLCTHTHTHTHIHTLNTHAHTHTENDYYNPFGARMPKIDYIKATHLSKFVQPSYAVHIINTLYIPSIRPPAMSPSVVECREQI